MSATMIVEPVDDPGLLEWLGRWMQKLVGNERAEQPKAKEDRNG